MIRKGQRFTDEEREKLEDAFDIVRDVFQNVRERWGCKDTAKKLDKVLEILGNLADI